MCKGRGLSQGNYPNVPQKYFPYKSKVQTAGVACRKIFILHDMAISLKEVYEICYEARHKWSNMLVALDVSNPSIESIRMKFHGDPDDCFRMGLSNWLSSGGTWEHIAAALSSPTVDFKHIADQVAKKHLNEIPSIEDCTITSTDAGKPTIHVESIYYLLCLPLPCA